MLDHWRLFIRVYAEIDLTCSREIAYLAFIAPHAVEGPARVRRLTFLKLEFGNQADVGVRHNLACLFLLTSCR